MCVWVGRVNWRLFLINGLSFGLELSRRARPIKSTPQSGKPCQLTQLQASKPPRATRTNIAGNKYRLNRILWQLWCLDVWPRSQWWWWWWWLFSSEAASPRLFSWTGIDGLKSREPKLRLAWGWLVTRSWLWMSLWVKKDMVVKKKNGGGGGKMVVFFFYVLFKVATRGLSIATE